MAINISITILKGHGFAASSTWYILFSIRHHPLQVIVFLSRNSIHPQRRDVFRFKPFLVTLVKFQICSFIGLKSFIKGENQGGLPNENFKELGRDVGEGLMAAKILDKAGYDCLDLDSGSYEAWYWAHSPVYHEGGLNLKYGKMIKKVVDVPVIIAGKMQNPDVAIAALEGG